MTANSARRLAAGSRTSKLALWQTEYVIDRLRLAWPGLECQVRQFVTHGDRTLDRSLPEIGGKGLFTAELEEALLAGEIDLAVHSLKDLPIAGTPGLTLGAITARADVRDALVSRQGWKLAQLPAGAVVGTSSLRRQAQLLAARPDLRVRPIRGNVDSRVRKVMEGEYDAAVLAAVGLERLGLTGAVAEWLPLAVMLPAPGQAALAVQCRAGDEATLALLAAIDDAVTRAAVTAERAFLAGLGGGCAAPVAAYAAPAADGTLLDLLGMVASLDGRRVVRLSGRGDDPADLGAALARQALDEGAGPILADLATPRPLQGRRIAVTRAAHQAQELCGRLAALGAEPVLVPFIQIEPLDGEPRLEAAVHGLAGYDWLIFTSANGVIHFWERLAIAGANATAIERVRVAAVGPATAQALTERGVEPAFVPDEFSGEQIALGLGSLQGRRVLLARSEVAGEDLPRLLAAEGAVVDDVPFYRTVPASLAPEDFAGLLAGLDAVTFASGSAVRAFAAAGGLALLGEAAVVCIGPQTAAVARELGLPIHAVAGEHTAGGLAQALVDYFAAPAGRREEEAIT